jgi:hypothetical protein
VALLNGFSQEEIPTIGRGEPDDKQKLDVVSSREEATNSEDTKTLLGQNNVMDSTQKPPQRPVWSILRLIVLWLAVLLVAYRQVKWKTGVSICAEEAHCTKFAFLPSRWVIFTSAIMVSMWWIGVCLAMSQQTWKTYNDEQGPKLLFMRRRPPRKPPDKLGKPSHDEYSRVYAEIVDRERVLKSRTSFLDRLLRRTPTGDRKRFMLLALQAAVAFSGVQPDITLGEHKTFRNHLRKYKRGGVIMTATVSELDRVRLRKVLREIPQGLLGAGDSFELIFDTGCTKTSTGFVEDFVVGTLEDLSTPIHMNGIAGGLEIKQQGTVRYEVLDDKGELQVLETNAFYIPSLCCRLFSPHTFIRDLQQTGSDPEEVAEMRLRHNNATFVWPNKACLTIEYDRQTHLPRVRAYKDAVSTAGALALNGCVTSETNQNLTAAQKLLLRWHFRLGHIGFATVQWLGRKGYLGPHGDKMGEMKLEAPKCAACQFGKQNKTSTPTHHSTKDSPGSLTKEKLSPGELIFSDQYESRTPGRAFTSKGLAASTLKYAGGTLFIDAASSFIHLSHQVGLTAAETIESKMRFERDAMSHGVSIQAYHTDNGIFTSREFMKDLSEKGQGISLSGVSAQFQNGSAENGIKIVVRNARTMMLHVALRWPKMSDTTLWPMALSHAVYLWNQTPKSETGVAPVEVFTGTILTPQVLRNSHPWGCPAYVLAPKLKDGQKIPKWDPRSRRGQYMGVSPMHASTVGLVRNLQTGSITPQFHVVYDDFFETVHSEEDQEPKEWVELLQFSRFKSDYDEEGDVPELAYEWLSDTERIQRDSEREQERISLLDQRNTSVKDTFQQLNVENSGSPIHGLLPNSPQTIPHPTPNSEGTPMQMSPQVIATPQRIPTAQQPVKTENQQTTQSTVVQKGRPTRTRVATKRFSSDEEYEKYYAPRAKAVATLCWTKAQSLVSCVVGEETSYRYLLALLTDVDTGTLEGLHPGINQFPNALKAAYGKDPDNPTYHEAMLGSDREQYEEAMVKEITELELHKTWTMVKKSSVPANAKVLPSTWVLRLKRYPDGRERKHKARFCVRGDRQVEGIDYTEKYSPVVSWSTVRMLLSMSLSQNLESRQVDFSNAFVQANLAENEHIYVALPKGFESGEAKEEQVLKLNRSLYGLVQAPLYWGNHLKAALIKEGWKQSVSDPCMFVCDGMILLTYVDDVLFFGRDGKKIDKKIQAIEAQGFKLTIEEDVYAFLGVEVIRLPGGVVELKQSGLIAKILKTCDMENCNTKTTPCNQVPLGEDRNGSNVTGKFEYSSVVGMLMYLSSNTRPDIQYSVHQCARFNHFPKKSHEDAICRICRYLQGTKDKGLRFKPDDSMKLDCYVDADFAGLYSVEDVQDPVSVKSRTGYCLTLGNCPVIWVSKLQTEIALSTTEAEYIALSQSMRDLLPMRRLLEEAGKALNLDFSDPAILHSTVFEDNNGAISLALSPKMTPRTKHIAIKYHHFREHVGEAKGIIVVKIDTNLQKADIFTKGLSPEKHQCIRKLLMGW